ncbi:hypothetical protein V499_06962 [Pseudogymnoascus sp. VKM F-103]|nr:hypothetical protein V499_06962 [Pseudogymnoascus sp. VKM F-103]
MTQIQQAYDTSQLIITTHFLYRVRLSLANSSRRPARPSSLAASSVCNALCLPLIIRDNNNNNEPLTNNDPPGNGTKRLLILLNHCLIMSDTGDSLLAFNKTPALHFNSAGVMQELVAWPEALICSAIISFTTYVCRAGFAIMTSRTGFADKLKSSSIGAEESIPLQHSLSSTPSSTLLHSTSHPPQGPPQPSPATSPPSSKHASAPSPGHAPYAPSPPPSS